MNSSDRLMFYVDPAWRGKGMHTPLLNPWWGNPFTESSLFTKEMFDRYSFDTSQYSITDNIASADLVLAPYSHGWFLRHNKPLFDECVERARTADLPMLIDGASDFEYPITSPNTFVLRYGGYRFLSEPGRIQIPPFADDLLERCRNGVLTIRPKGTGKATVGFAGWASVSLMQRLRTVVKELPVRLQSLVDSRYRACKKGVLWREKALAILRRSPLVTFRGFARNSFSGSAKSAAGNLEQLREEMVQAILESDYALDIRGDANNSTRLFEILSLGRIPVILDTERNFPFRDEVDYQAFSLIVDFRDLGKLPEKVAAFHASVTPDRFEEMQRNAREAYLRYFRVDALTRMIMGDIRNKLSQLKKA